MLKLLCALAVLCLAVSVTGSRSEVKPDAGTAGDLSRTYDASTSTGDAGANEALTEEGNLAGYGKRHGDHSYHKRDPSSDKHKDYEEPKSEPKYDDDDDSHYSGDKEYDTPSEQSPYYSDYYPPSEPRQKEYYKGPNDERWGGYHQRPYHGHHHSGYRVHKVKPPTVYYGYQSVCDDSKGLQVAISPGLWRNGSTPGNLAAASASCGTRRVSDGFTFQVGGYCSVACRQTANLTVDNTVTKLGIQTSWYSDDTRDAAGRQLFGPDLSYPGYEPLRPRLPADDILIADQINFGTYDGAGVMKMWATRTNSGKASVRFYRPWTSNYFDGSLTVAPGTALANIQATFRWYSAGPRTIAPAFNMLLRSNGIIPYSLAWIRRTPGPSPGWNEYTVGPDTDGWRLFCNNFPPPACPGGSTSFTMNQLLSDSRFGSILTNADIVGVGFNHGSGSGDSWLGIDWLQTNLLNNNQKIDFGPDAPEPPTPTLPTVGMGAATIGGTSNGFFASPTGWMFGVGAPEADPPIVAQTSCFGPAITTAGSSDIESECANIAFAVCCAPRTAPART